MMPMPLRGVIALRAALAAAGGAAMYIADRPHGLAWLQLVAFVPLFVAVRKAGGPREAAFLGAAWATARWVPLGAAVGVLALPPAAVFALAVYLVGAYALFGAALFAVRNARAWVVALAAGTALVAIESVDAALPMWGTTLSLARDWVGLPWAIRGLVRLAGVHSVAFCVVAAQAFVWGGVQRRSRASACAGALLPPLALLASEVTGGERTDQTLRIATIAGESRFLDEAVDGLLVTASQRGVRLVVLSEATAEVHTGERNAFMDKWAARARSTGLTIVVPFIDRERPGNRLVVFDPHGSLIGEYTKRHVVPLAEDVPPGDGSLLVFDVDGHRVGTLICQDDNYPDVASEYALRGVELLVSPTFEGPLATAPYHLANASLRTIEHPIALARAATRGTSALIAPGGHAVASAEDTHRSAVLLVGDLPLVRAHE